MQKGPMLHPLEFELALVLKGSDKGLSVPIAGGAIPPFCDEYEPSEDK